MRRKRCGIKLRANGREYNKTTHSVVPMCRFAKLHRLCASVVKDNDGDKFAKAVTEACGQESD